MKKILILFCMTSLSFSLFSYEIYKTNIYPGVVNHSNTSYSYGIFHLNTMESDFSSIIINRILSFNNSLTRFEYSYNSEGQLTGFNESFQAGNRDIKESGNYTYEYKEGKLATVQLNGKDIYFPSPYFLRIRSGGDELFFDLEFNAEKEIISILLNDKNGTKYFFSENRLKYIESIGVSENRLSASYDYHDNDSLKRYRIDYEEGKGLSRKKTSHEFIYSREGIIERFFFEKSGQGQDFERISCTFEYITEDDQSIDTIFALNDDGEILRTARFEYKNRNNYTVKIYDDQNRLIITYEVEMK